MARPLRIEFPNALYHITSRGNRREDIYFDDSDRSVFLDLLLQVRERFNWVFHSGVHRDTHSAPFGTHAYLYLVRHTSLFHKQPNIRAFWLMEFDLKYVNQLRFNKSNFVLGNPAIC